MLTQYGYQGAGKSYGLEQEEHTCIPASTKSMDWWIAIRRHVADADPTFPLLVQQRFDAVCAADLGAPGWITILGDGRSWLEVMHDHHFRDLLADGLGGDHPVHKECLRSHAFAEAWQSLAFFLSRHSVPLSFPSF